MALARKEHANRFCALLLVCMAGFCFAPRVHGDEPLRGKIVAVTDGDTVKILVGTTMTKVRLWGIDAPEHAQAFGERSKQSLGELCFAKDAEVTSRGTDRYGRTLGVIRVGKLDVNLEQVRRGLAWWYQHYAPQAQDLREAELAARSAKRGLWVDPVPVPPWEFRRASRSK